MDQAQYQKLEEIFFKALELSFSERAAFVAVECEGNAGLMGEVNALLASHDECDNFLSRSALDILNDKSEELGFEDAHEDRPIRRRFGKFEIQTEIGKGGMAVVYKAFDFELREIVALKLINDSLSDNYRILRRFKSEGLILSKLIHKNIVRIYERGVENGIPFISMEFLDGRDLDYLVKKKKLVELKDKLGVLAQISLAMSYIHSQEIIHRDIKPKNVMVLEDGLVKLMDFGIAKQVDTVSSTGNGSVIGTVAYMSPEQLASGEISCSSDIFSFAVMICEVLTGRRPFDGFNVGVTISNILNAEPSVRWNEAGLEGLRQVVLRSLQKDSKKRPSIAEVRQALLQSAEGARLSSRAAASGR